MLKNDYNLKSSEFHIDFEDNENLITYFSDNINILEQDMNTNLSKFLENLKQHEDSENIPNFQILYDQTPFYEIFEKLCKLSKTLLTKFSNLVEERKVTENSQIGHKQNSLDLLNQIESLKTDLEAKESAIEKLEEDLSSILKENNDLLNKLQNLELEKNTEKKQLNIINLNAHQHIEILHKEKANFLEKIKVFEIKLSDSSCQLKGLESENVKKNQEIFDLCKLNDLYTKEIDRLKSSLLEKDNLNEILRTEYDNLKESIENKFKNLDLSVENDNEMNFQENDFNDDEYSIKRKVLRVNTYMTNGDENSINNYNSSLNNRFNKTISPTNLNGQKIKYTSSKMMIKDKLKSDKSVNKFQEFGFTLEHIQDQVSSLNVLNFNENSKQNADKTIDLDNQNNHMSILKNKVKILKENQIINQLKEEEDEGNDDFQDKSNEIKNMKKFFNLKEESIQYLEYGNDIQNESTEFIDYIDEKIGRDQLRSYFYLTCIALDKFKLMNKEQKQILFNQLIFRGVNYLDYCRYIRDFLEEKKFGWSYRSTRNFGRNRFF